MWRVNLLFFSTLLLSCLDTCQKCVFQFQLVEMCVFSHLLWRSLSMAFAPCWNSIWFARIHHFQAQTKWLPHFSLSLSGLLVCHVFYNSKCSLCACHQMWMLAISIEMPPCSKLEHPLLLINLMPHNRNCNCIWSSRLNANGRAMMKLRQCILHVTICQVWFQIYCPEMNSFMNEEKA